MENDKQIIISVGSSRRTAMWYPQKLMWSDFVARLREPVKSTETLAEFKNLPKTRQDDLKDVGGFVGGSLIGNKRGSNSVQERHIITLDADNIPPGETQNIINVVSGLNCAYAIYSTRKHENSNPRLRILFPVNRPLTADEYQAVARKIAHFIGMDYFDPTTFEPSRLMYFPSVSTDSEYVFTYEDKPWVSVDGILEMYNNWKDCDEWHVVSSAAKMYASLAKKQSDPTSKSGVVGAFCRAYSVEDAIENFIPEVYISCEASGRYTFAGGSTVGGAVLYDDGKFLFSHHGTDPCSGKLCNAFDLVRHHLFDGLDDSIKPDTPTAQMPSHKAMLEFAVADSAVSKLLNKERYEGAVAEFKDSIGDDTTDLNWMAKLKVSSTTALPMKTIDNILIVLNNDPQLKGCIAFDEFAKRPVATRSLPWRDANHEPTWGNIDALNCGVGWIYPYYNQQGDFTFKRIKPHEITPGWADAEHTTLDYVIRIYEVIRYDLHGETLVEKVEVYDENGIYKFILENGHLSPDDAPFETYFTVIEGENQTGWNWLKIPLIPFKFNSEEMPLIKNVKSLQDGLNTILSNFQNNMEEDARNTILVLVNYDGEELSEFRKNLATYGAVKIRTIDGAPGDLRTLQVEINAENYKTILDIFKKAIIENAMGYDAKSDRLSGNPNQMNIQSMYSDIDLDANEMETEFQASIEELLWFIDMHFTNVGKGDFENEEVEVIFNRDILINETEAIDNCQKSVGVISDETIVENHPWIDDPTREMQRLESQNEAEKEYAEAFAPPEQDPKGGAVIGA